MATKEKKPKKPRLRLRRNLLYIGSFIAFTAPLVICFILKRDEYIKAPGDALKLGVGGVILGIIIALMILGRMKMQRRIIALGVSFIMAYLLQAVLDDLVLLLGLALLGEALDLFLFKGAIKRVNERIHIEEAADANEERFEKVLKKYVGRI